MIYDSIYLLLVSVKEYLSGELVEPELFPENTFTKLVPIEDTDIINLY
jgi:hypothetical protein